MKLICITRGRVCEGGEMGNLVETGGECVVVGVYQVGRGNVKCEAVSGALSARIRPQYFSIV